jgi:hypothetical protein
MKNEDFKLFGKAAFDRILTGFGRDVAAHSVRPAHDGRSHDDRRICTAPRVVVFSDILVAFLTTPHARAYWELMASPLSSLLTEMATSLQAVVE